MNEKEFLMDILETEKNMSVNMVYALNEASSKYLYDKYFKMFKNINKATKDIFSILYDKGYYQIDMESNTKLKDAYNMLKNELES